MQIAEGVVYRWLDGPEMDTPWRATEEEWSRIDEMLATQGWMSLSRTTTRLRIAEGPSGQIAGFLACDLLPHVGSAYVVPSQRGTGVAQRLADDMVKFMRESECRGWIVVADSPHSEKIAQAYGMTRVESPVYRTT